jgi:hypothetical protein
MHTVLYILYIYIYILCKLFIPGGGGAVKTLIKTKNVYVKYFFVSGELPYSTLTENVTSLLLPLTY